VGVTASAQTNDQAGQSKDQQGEQSKDQQGDSQRTRDSSQSQDQTERIRGELAGASVVGETIVDFETGRAIEAQFTYLTILGSPAEAGRRRGQREQAGSGRDDANRGEQDKDKEARSGDRDQGSNQDLTDRDRGNRDQSGERSASRRNVYQIAVSPETQVRNRSSQGRRGQGPDDQPKRQGRSAREQSQSDLEELQLGERVEVEFTRMEGQDRTGSGAGGQGGSGNQTRHGRNRIIRGVAKTITILSIPDQESDEGSPESRKGDDSSSGGQKSGADAQEKKTDREK